MKVGTRLVLAVLPAIVGVFLVAALAYWGEYGRTAPEWLVVVAGITTLGSLIITWRNTRYVGRRIERLARRVAPDATPRDRSALAAARGLIRPGAAGARDEIDSLGTSLDRLDAEATAAREESAEAGERVREYAALLTETVATVDRQLDEVRLPLHILLEHHFGSLNENQEEMLGAARQAADQAGEELRRLRLITQLDQGALALRRDPVAVADLLRGLQPLLVTEAQRRGLQLVFDLTPGLPRVSADRLRLQEALELLLRHLLRHTDPPQSVTIRLDRNEGGGVALYVHPGPVSILSPDVALARRIVGAHGGTLQLSRNEAALVLP